MTDESYRAAVRAARLGLADLLEPLDDKQWNVPSLCAGWRVRDVAGHVAVIPALSTWTLVAAAPRGRFSPDRINTLVARREGAATGAELVARLRERADLHRTARALDTRNSLFDVLVHCQDVARPLGLAMAPPPEHLPTALQRVWEMGWPFGSRERFAGLRFTATDCAWAAGEGPEVTGPGIELLLLHTGRGGAAVGLGGEGRAEALGR